MTDADRELIDDLGKRADNRFWLVLEKERLEQELQDRQAAVLAEFEPRLSEVQEAIERVDDGFWHDIEENRSTLIKSGKNSFPTLEAIFQLRKVRGLKIKVTDKEGVLKVARRLRITREIANPPKGGWRLDQKKLLRWLEKNPGWHHFFGAYVEDLSGEESLTIRPNGTYTTYYRNERISPPSVKIEKKKKES